MKKKIFSALLLMSGMCLFTACQDDNDSNPVALQPTSFVLNEPSYAQSLVDLENSTTINLTTSQPDYGYTAPVLYYVQVSLTNQWDISLAQAEADETGALKADYAELDENSSSVKVNATASLMNMAIEKLGGWDDADKVPAEQTIYVRLRAVVDAATDFGECYSNVITLKVSPYYVALKNADIEMWYLIGSCIGDGKWTNDASAIGTSMYPLSVVKDYVYDAKTGQGELTTVAYLTTSGFKMVRVPGGWDEQWGQADSFGSYSKNDGGSGNICVPADGYYTITLNTQTNVLDITPMVGTPATYAEMGVSGGFNDWGFENMKAVNTVEGVVNHMWTYDITTADGTELKFLTDSSWSTNWGDSAFPNGYGTQNGPNVVVPAGSWTIIFNDIDGSYEFIAK